MKKFLKVCAVIFVILALPAVLLASICAGVYVAISYAFELIDSAV